MDPHKVNTTTRRCTRALQGYCVRVSSHPERCPLCGRPFFAPTEEDS